ncbi:MAG: hypothetical protein A4E45_00326 [Methanosaeta sp. PtaB.Bin039]|nr:MAG: hypothetical protein A4E45_00326 [Methanosaeta sp. PtaB.Bin039]HOT07420.1 KEOPS complex subunit Pcc1 [Methanotrichaceae archaeon]HQF17379.1 KEOPS complex subunit Pcc1 [Methanotrichaceae archaeon]HQI91141.1 KEOPS complex subunit Pcc1 [Methanotrichaceae archaeon]HQJ29210.1 KEOPS complex subunit Pcc1 [Methanotrichaceae archaeon]
MIKCSLTFFGSEADKVACAIRPDNLPNMTLEMGDGRFAITFSSHKPGTILSTADDILMNVRVAEEALASLEDL